MENSNSQRDSRFQYLLNEAINKRISCEDEDELTGYLFDSDTDQSFQYKKEAAERGYSNAYCALGRAYLSGRFCEKSTERALYWFRLSVKNGGRGNAELGDCYRTGTGVPRDFDKAWEFYIRARQNHEDRDEEPSIHELTLDEKNCCNLDFMESCDISSDWWEYAITKVVGSSNLFGEMTMIYEKGAARWRYWTKKAADAGNICSMRDMIELAADREEQEKYIMAILNSDYTIFSDWIIAETAKRTIAGDFSTPLKNKAIACLEKYGIEY